MAPSFPHHTTFAPGELARLEDALRNRSHNSGGTQDPQKTMGDLASASLPPLTAPIVGIASGAVSISANRSTRSGSRLLKEYACSVVYPDGGEGICHYERRGPAAHRFQFMEGSLASATNNTGKTGNSLLAMLWWIRPLGNYPTDIEDKALELVPAAFAQAVEQERREYFARASESQARTRRPECFQMAAERARLIGGKYALCVPVGNRLLPVSLLFDRLEDTNAAWLGEKERGNLSLVVGCGNRLDRCWERPRYNALYKDFPEMAPHAVVLGPVQGRE